MDNQLLILEGSASVMRSKIQISDFLTFRLGWWCPRILFIDSKANMESKNSDLLIWFETRSKLTHLTWTSPSRQNTAQFITDILYKNNIESIVYIEPDFSPARLLDEFWIELGSALKQERESCIFFNCCQAEEKRPIGFAVNKKLIQEQMNDDFPLFKKELIRNYSFSKQLEVVPNLFHPINSNV